MKELNSSELKSIELGKAELIDINGGKVAYWVYTGDNWAVGLCAAIYCAAASIRNRFGD